MWLIAGTVPHADFPLYISGRDADCRVVGHELHLAADLILPVARGTPALVATALLTCQAIGAPAPQVLLAGDTGSGAGSARAYSWLADNLARLAEDEGLKGLTFHYFYPDADWHNRLFMAVQDLPSRPIMVADAGFMYAAKMSGYAGEYDLFTPDMGELAFLADENAPHPFYTRGFLLAREEDAPSLIARAREFANCPPNMIVKGQKDYIVCNGEIKDTVAKPSVPAMECIGGTGDLVTGFATAYLAAGYPICKSLLWAARSARCLGAFSRPTPATQIAKLIGDIEPMLAASWSEITAAEKPE